MVRLTSAALAARQVELDRAATGRFPELFDRKRRRLLASPHAFLRGSAPLFYELLLHDPQLAAGPDPRGWVVGDMHLENVGAYRTDGGGTVFELNDFDDVTADAPLHFDVLRLATSVLLGARSFRATGLEALALVDLLIASYVAAVSNAARPPPWPPPVEALVRKAETRTTRQLLDDRAPLDRGRRRFVRGERYRDLSPEIREGLPALLAAYVAALGPRAPSHAAEWAIEDAAFRIAGTGSLGTLRIAVLVRERNGTERLLELKEARPASVAAFGDSPGAAGGGDSGAAQSRVFAVRPAADILQFASEAHRVVGGAAALVPRPPRHLAAVPGLGTSFFARKLFPQEDKLGVDQFHAGTKLEGLVQTIGYVLGAAHARSGPPGWTVKTSDLGPVVDRAVEIAGVFEATYLAYARLAARETALP